MCNNPKWDKNFIKMLQINKQISEQIFFEIILVKMSFSQI